MKDQCDMRVNIQEAEHLAALADVNPSSQT